MLKQNTFMKNNLKASVMSIKWPCILLFIKKELVTPNSPKQLVISNKFPPFEI